MNNSQKKALPSIFISHGAPTLIQETNSLSHQIIKNLPQRLYQQPDAIVIFSAHWGTDTPLISNKLSYDVIYDFYGFPQNLYTYQYQAKGNPLLAEEILESLKPFNAKLDSNRNLDHGAWIPLLLMFPKANIPVVQVSISPRKNPNYHYQLGQALSHFRNKNILIIGSGGISHNLMAISNNSETPSWTKDFINWFEEKMLKNQIGDLLEYRKLAPHAEKNHPTDEHLLPIFVCLGTVGNPKSIQKTHDEIVYGVIGMNSYLFE